MLVISARFSHLCTLIMGSVQCAVCAFVFEKLFYDLEIASKYIESVT